LTLRESLFDGADSERVGLDRLGGRVLAADVTAERDVPARTRATMDGFGVAAADESPRTVRTRETGPGDDPGDHRRGTAMRVATGGPLPRGADAVVPVEDARVEDGTLVTGPVTAGQHVVTAGSVVEAGETVLPRGRRLAPRDAVVLRELGRDTIPVRERLSTALLATGTEIHEGRAPDRDSECLAGLVRAWGGDPTLAGSVPDDPVRVGDRIAALADDAHVVVTTGGTGVSAADETSNALRGEATVRVENVALRPGSNVTVAWLGDESAVVASLPGVPGAAVASATVLLRPLFTGETELPAVSAEMVCDLPVPDSDLEFVVPVEFREPAPPAASGPRSVVPLGHASSSVQLYSDQYRPHRVASCVRLSAADGFVLTRTDLSAGEAVGVVPYGVVES